MHLKVFVIDPAPDPVYDITLPFLIVVAVVALMATVIWLRRRANS